MYFCQQISLNLHVVVKENCFGSAKIVLFFSGFRHDECHPGGISKEQKGVPGKMRRK